MTYSKESSCYLSHKRLMLKNTLFTFSYVHDHIMSNVLPFLLEILGKMPEIQLGVHTIRSHGAKVARTHMHDWFVFLFLVVMEIILNVIEPFHRFVGSGMMEDLKYPLQENTVPVWAVPVSSHYDTFTSQD